MDKDALALAALAEAAARLERRAATPDGATVFCVYDGRLRRIDVGGEVVTNVPLDDEISQVFARPQGDWIVVLEDGAPRAHVLAVEDAAPIRSLRVRAGIAP